MHQFHPKKSLLPLAIAFIFGASSASSQNIPNDAKSTCVVSQTEFNGWFESGTPAVNGVVKPADSVAFSAVPNCSFYKWSKQMFLWLTSPATSAYGGGTHIFDSPSFFDVSPADASGNRTFLPHTPGFLHISGVRIPQLGPSNLPVVIDKTGRIFEVQKPQLSAAGKPILRLNSGQTLEIERATIGADRHVTFFDKAGKTVLPVLTRIPVAGLALNPRLGILHKININGIPVFIDPSGNVVDVEQGQADDGVLVSQNTSLVYYATMVNDVYAYFLTGAKTGKITPANVFPTTQADLNKITAFAASHGKTFPDPKALAIEVKSSWVDVTGLPNLSSYITMPATIPVYNKSNPAKWVLTGQKNGTLALVGMHVVGSTNQHPEMVWATFEHFGNAPNGQYRYTTAGNVTKTVPQSTSGSWLFAANNAAAPFNDAAQRAQLTGSNVAALSGKTIGPSNVIRWKAFGATFGVSPNPIDGSDTASNTEIISIHNSVGSKMPAADIRSKYYMTGSTWGIPGLDPTTNAVGTNELANTTMETFQQGPSASVSGSNCFSCHNSRTTNVSHVFPGLKALTFPPIIVHPLPRPVPTGGLKQ